MKRVKLIILSITILFLTGCTVNYNIEIEEDTTLKEYVELKEHRSAFYNSEIMDGQVLINNMIEEEIPHLTRMGYNYKNSYLEDYVYVDLNNTYDSFNDYITTSEDVYTQWFETLNVIETGTIVEFEAVDFLPYSPGNINKYDAENVNINIIVPFAVSSHNADRVSVIEDKIAYTWTIDEETTDKTINIVYDTSKKAKTSWTFEIIIGILVLAIAIAIYISQKKQKFDKINKI